VPTLADAADPLGKLQRGLGAGYLWALDADRAVAHALLMHCVFNDPRWDRQLDDRDDYHATLALDVQLHTGALELWLRDSDEDIPDTTYDVLGMLGRMAVRGHADAQRVLREYVAYGRYWQRAIDQLIGDPDAPPRSATPWPEAVGGLDAVLVERFATDDALAEALAGLDPRERPWTMWSVENPRIARAFALEQKGAGGAPAPAAPAGSRRRGARERTAAPARTRPREMTTAELLQIAEDSRWTQIADELAARAAPEDVEQLLRAADDPDVPMRRAAILALGRQGRRELLTIAEQHTRSERNKLQGAIALALEAMPMSQTRALAHDWLNSPDWASRRKAAGMLATWSQDEDLAPARRALERELDAGLEGDVYVICSLAQTLGRSGIHGPFVELQQAYEQIPYSFGRRYIVAALAASDPTFGGDVAVECLWDCEAETRRLAAVHVDGRVRLAAQRLEELAADDAQSASVSSVAAGRLRE
jgi:HEAT repeat protein